jgi:signal transduction histidine kinase
MSVNLNYEIEYVNEVFVNAFRASFGKVLARGVNIIESLPESLGSVWKERYDRAFANEHFLFEDRLDTILGPVYIEVAMNPIVMDSKVIGVSVYGKDVTDKKLNQIQLQYQSELRKLLVEVSSRLINLPINEINSAICQSLSKIGEFVGADRAYVFIYDFSGNTSSNTFEWCREGITPQIQNLQNIDTVIFADIVETHKRGEIVKVDNIQEVSHPALKELLASQDVISLLTIPLTKDGTCLGFVGFDSVRAKHVYNDYEQQLLQVYAQTVVNAFERLEKEKKLVEAKEKAEESDRLKSAFLANMSHEIRTPMSGIIGFLNLLNEPDLSEENKSTYINIVTQSGQRLLDTINDIIEISKIESGVMQVNESAVNIRELFGFYDGFFRQQADQKGLEYKVINNLPATIEYVRTDKKKLDSIISNLVKNAIKFTPSGSIAFKCDLEDEHLVFSVKDTGIGIPKERLKSIFERFVQADLSTSRPHEGSGLGLSIVKAYIEMMKGSIRVESQVGRGTEFVFSVPYKADTEVKSGKTMPIPEKKNVSTAARILIAEDDYASYLFIQKALDGQGFTFFRTTNGEDTIEAVRKDPGFAAVLMDIKMPGISGLDATRKIREFNKTIPIIAQTAYSLAGDRELAIESGCTDYISKPINRRDLVRLISKYIGS